MGAQVTSEIQRKPIICLLVILPIIAGGGVYLLLALIEAYSRVKGVTHSAIPWLNALLITLPAFFLWIPIGLLVSNLVLYFISPLRRIAEEYVVRSGHPGFAESQMRLLKLLRVVELVCIPLVLLGFML
jgi:hypothetical protein